MKLKIKILLAALLIAVSSTRMQAIAGEKGDSLIIKNENRALFNFFDNEEILEITLQFNMKEFIKTRLDVDRYYDASLSVVNNDNQILSQDIKLKARGKMRRKYCSFPPILLKVRQAKGQKQMFEKGNYKLVTHCSTGGNFETYILKEYLAYKLYNLVTPYSFKTRLVSVNYVDSVNPEKSFKKYGILIEDVDDMAKRNNAVVVENLKVGQNHMDNYEMARTAIFNYMIGNTDWSVAEQHNTKVIKIDDPTVDKGIPVTYDFDYSGFVNTSYSSPNDKIPITHVTVRYFQGSCYDDMLFKQVLNEFEALQPQIQKAIREFPYMVKAQKKMAESYINGFFRKVQKEDSFLADINRTCLKSH